VHLLSESCINEYGAIFHGQQIKINEALSPHITHGHALVFARRHGGSSQRTKHRTQEMKLARFQSIFGRDAMLAMDRVDSITGAPSAKFSITIRTK